MKINDIWYNVETEKHCFNFWFHLCRSAQKYGIIIENGDAKDERNGKTNRHECQMGKPWHFQWFSVWEGYADFI